MYVCVDRQVASVSDGELTGRQGQLIAAMMRDAKTDYTKEAKLLLTAVEVMYLLSANISVETCILR